MKLIAPTYYSAFRCIADKCRHTCCVGWEVDIDAESLDRYRKFPDICGKIEASDTPHFCLDDNERCPFLNGDNLCQLILRYGQDFLCQICRDHPRFRNFWSDRIELGLGLVCEAAGRLILGRETPMELVVLSDDGEFSPLPKDEEWLLQYRQQLLDGIPETGPKARLLEYLIYRHLPDALYDGRVEERTAFIWRSFREITDAWGKTDGSFAALVECARVWSYEVEYDDEELERRLCTTALS